MRLPNPVTIDFETDGIAGRPDYPPKPVGVSIKYWNRKAKYYAWGHPCGNNCKKSQARAALKEAYHCKGGVLFHNAKFDVDVADVHFRLKIPAWNAIHDSMFLLFLDDPHQMELGLKPASERLLKWPAEERDAVGDWLVFNQPVEGVKISRAKNSPHYYGAYIAMAPATLVEPYANGDVDRTAALFKLLYAKTVKRGMLGAYDRERELMPILLTMERQGVSVGLERLRADVALYGSWQIKIDAWICKRVKRQINIDSGAELMSAMIDCGAADPKLVPLTPTGKYQTNKKALFVGVIDRTLLAVLKYRASLKTCMSTFMVPWLQTAEKSNGLIYTTWNQVRVERGSGGVGARTGRLSSSPNFQNIPNVFMAIFAHQEKGLPRCPWRDLPDLPHVRGYVEPFEDEVLIDRDFSQQELRLLAHFDGESILAKYKADPWLDFHSLTQEMLADIGKHFSRKAVKGTNFGLLYGMGVGLLAETNGLTVDEAKDLKNSILGLYKGLKDIYAELKTRARLELPLTTWGGREYYCEPAKIIDGKRREFSYKMINVLIQGSAADCTKQAIINFDKVRDRRWRILLNVHDQITVSVPPEDIERAMLALRDAMEDLDVAVPMLSEGKTSATNWAELQDWDRAGVVL